ncbi:MAG: restriction endonuclease subunit S [Deltaproteobacteria bacterium]|jgi:type I restriction enzyme S subunit|nr:restriction endonuclease subunit S [Deltaproteobacteria bacterium]
MTELQTMMPRYEKYKDSGVEWIGDIPTQWSTNRLKFISKMFVSNVDKNIKKLEIPVKLCNYVDVYKNNYITNNLLFMQVTATGEEIIRFKIKIGDVLITKDSEDWLDIGVPSLVKYEEPNLLCGYHLAIIRAYHQICGEFLFWSLLAQYNRIYFSIMANGVTRYGISQGVINNTWLLCPPYQEQITIATFLNCKTAKIDQAIAIKKKQINLLKERKQILIQNAVTKGLDPDAPMRDSGVEWIGEIPRHWKMKRAKYLFTEVDERSTTGKEELLSVSHITGVTPRSEKNVTMFLSENYTGSKTCQKDDLVFNIMWAWMGALGVSDRSGIISSSYGVFRQQEKNSFNSKYLEYLLKTTGYIEHYCRVSTGLHSSRLRFYGHMFFNMEIGFPDRKTQDEIITHIQTQSTKINKAIALQEQMIDKLKEYKATLINSAVTGKIKVPMQNEANTADLKAIKP